MYDIETLPHTPILRIPVFWILSGLLIFYSGVYFFNTAYSYMSLHNIQQAKNLRAYINVTLNIFLYFFWINGFICSTRIRNYTYH